MNKTLALYFDDHFVMGAIEPYDGKFTRLEKGDKDRFYLYFYLDDGGIYYGKAYRNYAEEDHAKLITDFYEKISTERQGSFTIHGYQRYYVELLEPIISDIREAYTRIISQLSDDADETDPSDDIPLRLGFSPNLPEKAKEVIREFLANRGFDFPKEKTGRSLAELLLTRIVSRREVPIPEIMSWWRDSMKT